MKDLLLCASFLDPRLRTLDFIVCNEKDKIVTEKNKIVEAAKKRVKADVKKRMLEWSYKPQMCSKI